MRLLPFVLLLPLAGQHLRLHPDNPHYFQFRGKPTVVVTSAEHYGAVLNLDFNYKRYLDTLAAEGMNLTRIFTGLYRERPGDFSIASNTLAPKPSRFVQPYLSTKTSGGADGLMKVDLNQWNPAYFDRLKDFIRYAGERGILVEVTLFCTYYQDWQWESSPLHTNNNINGVPTVPRTEALTMKHPALVAHHDTFVRKVVTELKDFDNILYEICNEAYFGGVTLEWQRHIAQVVSDTEAPFTNRHLVAQNFANYAQAVTDLDSNVSVLNFHYARPPETVAMNYQLNRPIALDETGFDGTMDYAYRIQAWDFLIAGGAYYNNLDYSFTAGNEDGAFVYPPTQPGGGSTALRRQLKALREFVESFDFIRMRPANHTLAAPAQDGTSIRVLAEEGNAYAAYVHRSRYQRDFRPRHSVNVARRSTDLVLNLPTGQYTARWFNPHTGKFDKTEPFTHAGGPCIVASPEYTEDIALDLRRSRP